MEAVIEQDLMEKISLIVQSQNRDLLKRFIDILYEQALQEEEYFSPEDMAAIQEGLDALARGDKSQFISLEEYEKERGL